MKTKYIDIHNHSLSGVDDGARSLEESLAMFRQAVDEGIGTIVLTPHQKPDRPCLDRTGVKERVGQIQKVLRDHKIPIELYPGGEVLYSHDMTGLLEREKVSVLADSRYVLTEFLPGEGWAYIRNGLYDLQCAGYIPVIAHTERCINVACDTDRVEELRDSGCLIQVNAGSLTGFGTSQIKRAAKKLVKEQLADIVATDAHRSSGSRQVSLAGCAAWLHRKCGQAYAERLLYGNAAAVLNDEDIVPGTA